MSYKIMVIDDEQMILDMLRVQFELEQYTVITSKSCAEATQKLSLQPDIILLDINMPGMDGISFCQTIRDYVSCPILFLTARIEEADRVAGLRAGGDDYIMKPFSMTVLFAKIQALLRRTQQSSDQMVWANNHFNALINQLNNDQGQAQLTPTEGALLQVLIHHRKQTVTKDQLLEWLWQGGKYLNDNTLNVNISRLRSKLAPLGLNQALRTERGIGYRLVVSDE